MKDVKPEWSMVDRIYLAIYAEAVSDKFVRSIVHGEKRKSYEELYTLAQEIEQNPNRAQYTQRIFARAVADRLDEK